MSEWALLCRLTSPVATGDSTDQRGSVECSETVDWDRLLDLADAHGVLHHLGDRLAGVESVPDDVQSKLTARRREHTARALTLTNGLHTIHEQLHGASIDALAYKGPVLSAVAHGDLAARQYGDVDIVVESADFDRACDLLAANGYEQVERLRALGEAVYRNDAGVVVDLHRSVLPRYFPASLPVERLWERREHVAVGERSLPALDPVDRFLVLTVHGTKHCWYRLAWVHDVAALLVCDETDWHEVVARARSLGALRHVRLACWLAEDRFGVAVPRPLDPQTDPVVDELGAALAEERESAEATPPTDRTQFWFQWRTLSRCRDRARYAARLATIPSERDIESVPLPTSASLLYRVVRPVRLVSRYGRRAISRLLTGS